LKEVRPSACVSPFSWHVWIFVFSKGQREMRRSCWGSFTAVIPKRASHMVLSCGLVFQQICQTGRAAIMSEAALSAWTFGYMSVAQRIYSPTVSETEASDNF